MTSHHHGPKPDPDPMPRPPNTTTFTHALLTSRKKGTGIHEWLLLDSSGHTQVLEAGKHAIMRRVGLHARDLRILDPFLSYSSAVLGREKAIVINLEHIKAIITANEVLLLNSKDPLVIPFVEQLQSRVLRHFQATKPQDGNDVVNWKDLYDLRSGSGILNPRISSADFSHSQDCEDERKDDRKHDKNQDSLKILPFEFVALEACLEAACSCLESETNLLEEEAHPALEKLTSKISTLNLEHVRQIKSRLVAITGRVQKVRDELEHLLDDDEDMAEMYLTEKLVQWQLDNSSESSVIERDDLSNQDIEVDHSASTSYGVDINNANSSEDHLFHETHTGTTHSAISKPLNVEELEMLLEAYFVQIDGTLHKLSTLREYVDDTEAYINIMLDDKQNQLLQMGVMLSTATIIISSFIVVVGILGMNIRVELFKESTQRGTPKFLWTIGACTAGCIIMYFMAVSWYKHKRFLE